MTRQLTLMIAALLLSACGAAPDTNAPASSAAAPVATTAAAADDQPSEATPPASAADMYAATLQQVLAGAWRSDADKARDAYRHPVETLAFFEVKPNQTVIEITPGGGWYAKVLAPWIDGSGHYIAAVAKSSKPDSEAAQDESALEKLFKANPTEFGQAQVVEFDPKAPVFGPADSADRVLTFRNVHNWAMGGNAEAMFKGFFKVLKPGGILGVADHRASAGEPLDKVINSGYLPVEYVTKLATDAGFVLDAQSEVNANPKDDHHHEKGVWTLPPTLALGDKDKAKYQAIGESDRMTLRFVKPKPDEIHAAGMDGAKPAKG
ncbi:MAG TPA: methyltransferase [Rhodanobacteraceae bacterium]|nr:methyltransferase [Rhodanobacteraceae bacterium]